MKSFGKFLLGFLIGGFISSLLVLLFTPSSGQTIRDRLSEYFDMLRNEISDAAFKRGDELRRELAALQSKPQP